MGERKRKKEARAGHENSAINKKLRGHKAKMHNKKRYQEKATMKKTIKQHNERLNKHKEKEAPEEKDAVPAYLLEREGMSHAKVLSNSIKQKRKEKAWKRQVNKVTFVGESFTRKPPKYERFIRPAALRFKKASVTHPELKATFQLDLIGVKKNPQSPLYTSLGVITKGTIIEVNCSDLGLVTPSGKVVWGKYAQVTNNPENDGCINAVLLV